MVVLAFLKDFLMHYSVLVFHCDALLYKVILIVFVWSRSWSSVCWPGLVHCCSLWFNSSLSHIGRWACSRLPTGEPSDIEVL